MIDGSYEVPGRTPAPTPVRRLVATGIKRGAGPLIIEQPQLSDADKAAHAAASHVRRQQAVAHAQKAASLYAGLAVETRTAGDIAGAEGNEAYAAGCEANADRMLKAMTT